jgi:hypothetical protein
VAELKSDRSLKAVYVQGFDELMQKIENINPDTKKLFNKELRKQIKPVEKLAKSFIPSEVFPGWRDTKPYYPPTWGWAFDQSHRGRTYGKTNESRWQWSQADAVAGIQITSAKVKVQRGRGTDFEVTALALVNKSVPGIIFELTGGGTARSRGKTRRVSRNPNASEGFIRKVSQAHGAIAGDGKGKRVIYKATAEKGEQALNGIRAVIDKYLAQTFRGN